MPSEFSQLLQEIINSTTNAKVDLFNRYHAGSGVPVTLCIPQYCGQSFRERSKSRNGVDGLTGENKGRNRMIPIAMNSGKKVDQGLTPSTGNSVDVDLSLC